MRKKILITGGSGYLGRNLAKNLKNKYLVYLGSRKSLHSESLYKVSHITHMAIIFVFIRCSNKRLS